MTTPRPAPHSLEAEEFLLSCCLIDGAEIDRCADAGLTVSDFYLAAHAISFSAINDLHNDGKPVDVAVLAEELKRRKELDAVGGYPFLTQISGRVPTTAQAAYFIETVRELSTKRQLLRLAMRAAEDVHEGTTSLDLIDALEAHLSSVRHRVTVNKHRSLVDFDGLPEEDGRDELLGHNRYLGRGDSCLIVSSSGMGKSSMSMIWAAHLALGWDFLGIPTKRPSKSLIIQAEDSDGDIRELWFSIKTVMKLTGEQIEMIRKNVIIVRDKTNRGDAFIAAMRGHIARHKPDFVWLNPLHSFAGCKIEDAAEIGRFLREGLNKANRDEAFCYMIIHHTPKPMTGKAVADKKWHEVMYDAAGSAELVNWARAVITLKPTDVEGEFDLVLAKRGKRAGVQQEVQGETTTFLQATTKIAIKQSGEKIQIEGRKRAFYLLNWETRVIAEKPVEIPNAQKYRNSTTKAVVYEHDMIATYFPPSTSEGMGIGAIRRFCIEGTDMGESTFKRSCPAMMAEGLICQTEDKRWRRTPKGDAKAEEYQKRQP